MVIELKCECGERLVARDDPAGEMAECPSCAQPLRVPVSTLAALLDEEGVSLPKKCPDCMPPDAILCIHCGYNRKLGRKMKTKRR